jgi:hypothetical protein
LAELHFPGWTQVLDFVHLLVHVYDAATAAYRGQARRGWRLYEKLLRWAWAGEVGKVIDTLETESTRLGAPTRNTRDDNPRRIVLRVLGYVRANAHRMNYARYRRDGLPITSTAVESLVKQFNQRMKGTEKFWITGGAEALLQVRAAYLSDDDRAEAFHQHRPRTRAVGTNRRKLTA